MGTLVALALIGCASASTAPSAGQRVDIGGYQLYLNCAGSGSPTVILEAGLNAGHAGWEQVQTALAQDTRVCSYDRAGLGESDPGPQPRDCRHAAAELHALLVNADIEPPYLLVGHSFGALHIRLYAFDYPDEVAGLVFVDAVHEAWWARASALLPPERAEDSDRLKSFRAYVNGGYANPQGNREGIDIAACLAQIGKTGTFGQMPIVVLTAESFTVLAPGLPAEVEAQLRTLFQDELHETLAGLSTNSLHVVVPGSGHNIPQDNPQAVIAAVQALLDAGR